MRSRRIRHLLSWAIVVIIQIVTFVATTELTFSGYNKDLSLYPPGSYLIQRHQQFGDRGQKKINKVSDDLIPTDLILISSLDGSVRGVDRSTGNVYWTLQGGTSGSSVIRSTIHFRTKHDIRRQRPENSMHDESHAFDDFLMDDSEESSSQEMSVTDDDNADAEGYEMYYIVEPQNGGILYVYGEGRPLEKLPFSIQEIVAQSPVRTRRGTTYVGSKSTVMTAIDPRSGKILRKFDLDHAQDAYVMATQNRLPPHTIFLGRHDYKVAIFDNNNQKWWNLTYSEYVPNKLDWDVPDSIVASDIYIAPDTNGAITAVKVTNGEVLWSLDLHIPVVSVFDVYRRQDFTIALSKQEPPHTLQTGMVGELLSVAKQQQRLPNGFVYVGVYEGSLFAFSADHYPLVHLSGLAPMYRALPPGEEQTSDTSSNFKFWWNRHTDHLYKCKGCKAHVDFLVGRHPVVTTDPIPRPGGAPNIYPARRLLPGEYPDDSTPNYKDIKEGFFHDGPGKFWKSYLAAIVAICYASRRQIVKFYELYLSQRIKTLKRKFDAAKKRRARRSIRVSRGSKDSPVTAAKTLAPLDADAEQCSTTDRAKADDAPVPVDTTTKVETTPVTPTTPAADIQPRRIKARVLEPQTLSEKKPEVLKLSDTILGYGSHGTIVYKGEFDGRAVAVKRLLIDFYDIAFQEVKLLQESDDHPNVVRYYYKEESDRFLYIALELCYGSLHDYMERTLSVPDMQLFDQMDPANILYQIMCGIQHLHSLKIVHRDIKPQNILLAPSRQGVSKDKPPLRILLSDFGLCKKLEGEQSSFHYTTASPVGTVGWCAPELLANIAASTSEDSSSSRDKRDNANGKQIGLPPRGSRAIDIFAAGCVFYYVLSGGDHPFGPRFVRENNILKGDYTLDKLQDMGEDGVEAADLISRMLSQEPKLRPNADVVLAHPFFWTPAKRLAFLQDASDRFEVEQRDPPSPLLQRLESDLDNVIGGNWYRRIDRVVATDLGKFRKYDGKRVRDLLRALRNKKHHWQDLPEQVKATLGEPPDNYLYYFTARFPHLFLHTYYIIADDPELRAEGSMRQYF